MKTNEEKWREEARRFLVSKFQYPTEYNEVIKDSLCPGIINRDEWIDSHVSGNACVDHVETYVAARKAAQVEIDESNEEYLTIFLNECGFDNSGCYDISEVKRHFKMWIESEKEDRDQEIERLKKELPKWVKCDYCDQEYHNEVAADIYSKINQRDELIREAEYFATRYYESKHPKKKDWQRIRNWLEKARKIVSEK